jgi:coenzyme F420-reducing hydrogenase delta subunit
MACKWHPLTAMENAARDGFEYDGNAVVMPVKCTGLVKVSHLLKLFAKGMAGVLVLGCREDDCRYYNGSKRCGEIVGETQEILDLAGIARESLQFHLISESQGDEFKRVLTRFLRQVGTEAGAGARRTRGKKNASVGGGRKQAGKTAKRGRAKAAGRKQKRGRRPAASKKRKRRGTSH